MASEAGISQELFWAYTPRELDAALRAAVAQREQEERLAILTGWVAAYCTRAKRMPGLKSLLDKTRRTPQRQTAKEQIRTLKMITAMYAKPKKDK